MRYLLTFLVMIFLASCQNGEQMMKSKSDADHVQKQVQKFVPVKVDFDRTILPENEMLALKKLVQASKYMDIIFLQQVYSGNEKIDQKLRNSSDPDQQLLYKFFKINYGPFDRLEHDKPFIENTNKPKGANYYPEDMSKEEFTQWVKDHPDEQEAFEDEFTLIRRDGDGLIAIPYAEAYKELLDPTAALLKEAAELTANQSLKRYLNSRADAFSSNDYFQSDMDWVDLKDHLIEVVIGPYEVYEDGLFGYKAAFESFVTIVDPLESKKLATVAKYLDDMERHLPFPREHMNFNRGKKSPIMVVQEVFAAGDTKAGVQTAAFNLPNDERVREAKGSKKVMLKNIIEAKFENILRPIVAEILAVKELSYVSFESFFNHILMHEMSHGIGPGTITKNDQETTVSRELQDLYSTIEETKADILGVYNVQFMIEKGIFPKSLEENLYRTFLGGIFRSVRFGIAEAHGGANVISLNYLIEKGGFEYYEKTERFGVNADKIKPAIKSLAHDLLMIEALGDYEAAQEFVKKYRYVPESLQKALDKVKAVPVDIYPQYAIENEL
jgi:hypothetical protein